MDGKGERLTSQLIWREMGRNTLLCLAAVVAVAASAAYSGYLLPQALQKALDGIFTKQGSQLGSLLIGLAVTGGLLALSNSIVKIVGLILGSRAACRMENEMIKRWSGAAYRGHSLPGMKLLAQIRNNVKKSTTEYIQFLLEGTAGLAGAVVGSVFIASQNLLVCLLILLVVVLVFVGNTSLWKKFPEEMQAWQDEANGYYGKIWERVENKEAAVFLNQQVLRKGMDQQAEKVLQTEIPFKKTGGLAGLSNFGVSYVLLILVGVVGGVFVLRGNFSAAALVAVMSLIPGISSALLSLPYLYSQFKTFQGSQQMLDKTLQSIQPETTGKACPPIEDLQVNNLCFAYDGGSRILERINFSIHSGEFVALAGKSGCGKSTFINLLMKKLPYETGDILVQGQQLAQIDRQQYWNRIAYVSQSPCLIKGSIADNIVLGAPFDSSLLMRCIQDAGLEEFIDRQPEKADTFIDKNTVSSGELQKINMARAFYRQPALYVLDEATSAMDPAAEQNILASLKKRKQTGAMILFVSHREAVVSQADTVLFFSHEHSPANQPHKELLRTNPGYAKLLAKTKEEGMADG